MTSKFSEVKTMIILESLEELKRDVEWLLRKRERLAKALSYKGYSLKRINGHTYIYRWAYQDGKARWWCVGNINKVGIPENRTKTLLEEIRKIDEVLGKVAKLLEDAKMEVFSFKS
jgi:ribulose kinase